jgi:hypothetical protein
MSDQPPRWGEPGYVPPPRPKEPLRPAQQWALWAALALSILGQVAYVVGVYWGGTVCGGDPVYDHPSLALAGFLASVVALGMVLGEAMLSRWAVLRETIAVVVLCLVVVGLGWELLIPVGAGCW